MPLENSTSTDVFKPKEYDIYNAVLGVTEQIHGKQALLYYTILLVV